MKTNGSTPSLIAADLLEALAGARAGTWWWDRVSDVVTWSPMLETLFGVAQGTAPRDLEGYLQSVHPDDRGWMATRLGEVLGSQESRYDVEHRIVLPSGEVRWIQGRGYVHRDEQGRPLRLLGTAQDVTERRLEAERLRSQTEVLGLLAEMASDYVYQVDVRVEPWAPEVVGGSFERTTGYTFEQIAARGGWSAVHHPEERELHAATVADIVAGRPFAVDYRIVGVDGSIRWLRDRGRPERDPESGEVIGVVGAVQDITAEKQLEEQLIQAQKMEALAQMAGGVAHDLNNLLTIGYSGIDALGPTVTAAGQAPDLDAVVACLDGATKLTQSLLAFSRQRAAVVSGQQLELAVERTCSLVRRTLAANVRLQLLPGEPVTVNVDETGLSQVVTNLIINAADAVDEGGQIDVGWGVVELSAERSEALGLQPGTWGFVCVCDDGPGVPEGLRDRIFEPFFTTKGEGGSGLGLSVSHGIVKQWGGALSLERPERGSRFTVYLPVGADAAPPARTEAPRIAPGAAQRVVVVEDSETVRRVVVRALTSRGYAVSDFETAEQCLPALGDAQLLVTDIGLPGMSGVDLVKQARHAHPQLPVLVISGRARGAALGLPEGVAFLAKPFRPSELAHFVAEVLEGGSG